MVGSFKVLNLGEIGRSPLVVGRNRVVISAVVRLEACIRRALLAQVRNAVQHGVNYYYLSVGSMYVLAWQT